MAKPEQRDLAQIVRQRIDIETLDGLELRVCSPARAHEIGMVGVGKAVGIGTRRREHSLLLEREDQIDGARRDQDIRDRLGSLCIGSRVRAPLLDVELTAETGDECREEVRPAGFRGPDLEVRSSRPAERPGAEQRAAEVGGGAAAPSNDPARRTAERPV